MQYAKLASVLALLSFIASAATFAANADAPDAVAPTTSSSPSSSFTDRSAPGVYIYNNGTDLARGPAFSIPTWDRAWMQRFNAIGGADVLTGVSVQWYGINNYEPARVAIFQDTVGNGNPADRQLLTERAITVQSTTGNFPGEQAFYPLDPPVPVTGFFFVAFSYQGRPGEYPITQDKTTPYPGNRAFEAMTTTPPLNFNTAVFSTVESHGYPYNLTIRASGNGNSFSYQGQLGAGGANYSGNADFRFTIYDSASGGSTLAAMIQQLNVPVDHGVFSVRIPAQPSTFMTGTDGFLEIAVRTPADGGNFTTLEPRQRIGQVPSAMVATIAESAVSAQTAITALSATSVPWSGITGVPLIFPPWSSATGGIHYSTGNVGIGTSTPAVTLDVLAGGIIGNSTQVGGPQEPSNQGFKVSFGYQLPAFPTEFVGMRTLVGPGTNFCGNTGDIRFDTWECNTSASREVMRVTGRGNVGIGTNAPSQRLTVNGNVLANNVAVPSSIRFKDNVAAMDDALARLLQLEGVRFDWKPEWAKERPGREHDIGFVAEEVAAIFPEVVFRDDAGNVTGMDYSRLTAVAVQAIKQQQSEISLMRTKNEMELSAKQQEIDALRRRLDAIEKKLNERE